jgi:CHAT domain-containing protein
VAQPNPPDETDSTVPAAAAFLARLCLGERRADDEQLAIRFVERLFRSADGVDEVSGAVVGAVWAAFPGLLGDPDGPAWTAAAACARTLGLADDAPADLATLAAAALGLIAAAGQTDHPGGDLVRAANWARRVEQHDLAAWCARQALDREETLSASGRALALLVLAVATRSPDVVDRLYSVTAMLSGDDGIRVIADSLRPSLHPDERPDYLDAAGAAIEAEDRRTAAELLRRDMDALRERLTDDDMMRGLSAAYAALAAPELDGDALRSGLTLLIRYLRDRQRFGQGPPPAQAGIDLLLNLLTIHPGTTEAEVLVEVMDGLADAGLPELVAGDVRVRTENDLFDAELLQADIARSALKSEAWPRADSLIEGLNGCSALLLRRRRSCGAPGFVAVHLRPPNGLAIKNRAFPPRSVATLAAFTSTAGGEFIDVPQKDLDALVDQILPDRLRWEVKSGKVRRLVIVPDDDLWHVPWAASMTLRDVEIGLMPSVAQCARRSPESARPVSSVLAIVNDNVPGAATVIDALYTARATRGMRVVHRDDFPADPTGASHDLLLYFGHGAGNGLSYRMATARGRRTALAVARSGSFRSALIAACWSAGAPPPGLTLSFPAALLAGGVDDVIGGTWPLPAVDTGRVIAAVIDRLADGKPLVRALRSSLATVEVSNECRWGLAVYGIPAEPT